jgi:hypothetical protein
MLSPGICDEDDATVPLILHLASMVVHLHFNPNQHHLES